jgi:transposase
MAHFHVKKKKGRPYLYVREIARVDGKPKVVSQIYLGSPERVAGLASGSQRETLKLQVEEFGALWVAKQMDQDIELAAIIDGIIPAAARETGPTIGEYFLYCVWNRMIEAVSKNRLLQWYGRTAIQQIRPVDIGELTSQRYWEKWDRVSEQDLQKITRLFFNRICKLESPNADCLLFDTTNYYTFLASDTPSALARRGKSKEGRHHLRQIGLGLLVARDSKLPLYYSAYPGNVHDSKQFEAIMDEMFGIVCGLHKTKERLTVVIDKGMNSETNYAWIDDHARIHFVTTYSTYFAQKLATTVLDRFEPVDIAKNKKLIEDGNREELILAYRTKGEYWGKQRAVVVTYNPVTARKQDYTFQSKLETIRQELLIMRNKVRDKAPHWKKSEVIQERYLRLCERLHVSSDYYTIGFKHTHDGALSMSFRKDPYRISRKQAMFGKNIIITDNTDWTTREIVEVSLDRWQVEDRFRLSKNDDLVGTRPVRHWTDSKIRCHLFTCVVAMTYLRRLELKLGSAGVSRSAEHVMDDMQHLHSVLTLNKGSRKPVRRLETPTKTQSEVLTALGHRIDDGGVLQPITA